MSSPKELLVSAKRTPGGFFRLIDFGSVGVSIQGSKFHYCSPRIDLENLTDYDSLEIAILHVEGDEKKFVDLHNDERFKNFTWLDKFEPGDNPVAGYIPRADIEQIMRDVMSVASQMKN
jgi:hypothetical protein